MKTIFKPLVLLLLILTVTHCRKEKDLMTWSEVFALAGIVETENEQHLITENIDNDGEYTYYNEVHDVVENELQITHLGLNDDILWPGNILKGRHIKNFVYEPITLPRNEITLSVNIEGGIGGGSLYATVENPSLSTVRQGIHDIVQTTVGEAGVDIPAKAEINVCRVYSESHMNLAVGANISHSMFDFKSQFNWNEYSEKTRIVAKYKQIYYTINVDQPNQPSDFFDPSLSANDAADQITEGSCPAYVSGVSYGAMAFMFIESTYSESEVKLAIEASLEAFDVNVTTTTGLNTKEVFDASTISILVYGGSTSAIQQFGNGTLTEFYDYIKASSTFNVDNDAAPVPLVYSFRNLVNNTLVHVALSSQYTIQTRIANYPKFEVSVKNIHCVFADDEGADNTVEIDRLYVDVFAFHRDDNSVMTEIQSQNNYRLGWTLSSMNRRFIYKYEHPGDGYRMYKNKDQAPEAQYMWKPVFQFNRMDYDFNNSGLQFYGSARDYDTSSGDDWGSGNYEVLGADFLENEGIHKLHIRAGDNFELRIDIEVKVIE